MDKNTADAIRTMENVVQWAKEGRLIEFFDVSRGEYRPMDLMNWVPYRVRLFEKPTEPTVFSCDSGMSYISLTDEVREALDKAKVKYRGGKA